MEGFLRPESVILPEGSCVPPSNLIVPPPNQFTHQALRKLPYIFARAGAEKRADGSIPAGTKLALLRHESGGRCWVADEQGLYVEVDSQGVKPI